MRVKPMNYYCDIQIVLDPDLTPNQIMTALFMRFHHALVDLNESQIGVSFPKYQKSPRDIGVVLRLHGAEGQLRELLSGRWLKQGIRDHINISPVTEVPDDAGFCVVSRVQPKYNRERLIRRYSQRHQLSYEEAALEYKDFVPSSAKWPFIQMRSQSRAQTFSLFVRQEQVGQQVKGGFSSYGLSSKTTVPWF